MDLRRRAYRGRIRGVFVIGKFIAVTVAIVGTGVVVKTARDTEIAVREPTRPGKQRVSNRCISGPIRFRKERLLPLSA